MRSGTSGLDVGVGVGQQLARRVPVVPGQRQPEVLAGHAPPVAGLQAVLHDAGVVPPGHDAGRLDDRDANDRHGREGQHRAGRPALVESGDDHAIGHSADHGGRQRRRSAEHRAAGHSHGEDPWFVPDGPAENPHALAQRHLVRSVRHTPSVLVVATVSRPSTRHTLVRMTAFARSERLALCETLRTVGPDAPTLREGWLTRDLAAHLVLRESRPDAAPGIVVSALAGRTAPIQRRLAELSWPHLVDRVSSIHHCGHPCLGAHRGSGKPHRALRAPRGRPPRSAGLNRATPARPRRRGGAADPGSSCSMPSDEPTTPGWNSTEPRRTWPRSGAPTSAYEPPTGPEPCG